MFKDNLNSTDKIKFDPKIHEIINDSVFYNEKMKVSFHEYLIKELNSEPFEFYFEIIAFKEIKDFEEQKKMFLSIYESFFQKNAKKELNIPSKIKIKIKTVLDDLHNKKDFQEETKLLENISKTVKQELVLDAVRYLFHNIKKVSKVCKI
jgi:hypothetical protein